MRIKLKYYRCKKKKHNFLNMHFFRNNDKEKMNFALIFNDKKA